MSSTTQNIPSDSLPSTVPKLNPTGSNWAIFSKCFEFALTTRNMWGHFDGTAPRPPYAQPAIQSQQEQLDKWDKDERTALYMLTQKLPDSAVIRIYKFATCAHEERNLCRI